MALQILRVLRAIFGGLNVPDVKQITFANGSLTHEGNGNVTYTAPAGGGTGGTPAAHAPSHGILGSDPVTPASIGAQPLDAGLTSLAAIDIFGVGEFVRVDGIEGVMNFYTSGTIPSKFIFGLGTAATLNVGTAAGTVAAGNDARLSREIIAVPFAFGDAPQTIYTMPLTGRVIEAGVSYRTAFNGAAPTLTLGHNLIVGSILGTTDSDAKQADQYEVYPDLDLIAGDLIKIAIVPSGSTVGAGVVRLIISFGV